MEHVRIGQEVYAYDIPALQVVDLQGYDENNWEEKDFHNHEIRTGRTIDHVIAFGAYKPPQGKSLALVRFAVWTKHRRQGVGRRLMQYILDEAIDMQIKRVTCVIRESNEVGCYFLRAMGFKAVSMRNDKIYFKRNIE